MKGIDVSKYNQTVMWDDVKNAGFEFCMIRGGYGKEESQIDPQFERNYRGCERIGIKRGMYWFSYATNINEAIEEAKLCLKVINGRKLEMPIAFDFEYDSIRYATTKGITITDKLAQDIAKAFLDYVRNNSHYHVAIYTNPDMIERYYKGLEKEYDLWLAYWTKINPKEHYAYQIWQRGTVKINGKTFDENVCVKDYDAYPDIKGKWYQKAAKWCIENGVMVGYGDELFHGDDICTRGMLAQALYNLNNK